MRRIWRKNSTFGARWKYEKIICTGNENENPKIIARDGNMKVLSKMRTVLSWKNKIENSTFNAK